MKCANLCIWEILFIHKHSLILKHQEFTFYSDFGALNHGCVVMCNQVYFGTMDIFASTRERDESA